LKCDDCGFIFLNPRPEKEYFKSLYDPLSQYSYKVLDKKYIDSENEFVTAYHAQLENIEKLIDKGKLLEIGSALGYFLEAARQRGWEPFGVELSQGGSEYCRQKFGIDIFCGEIQDAGFSPDSFNCVVTIHTLEHVYDPNAFVQECRKVLKIGGVFVIEIPYVKDNEHPESMDILKDLPAHLSFFTTATLSKLLESSGFILLDIQKGDNLRIACRKQ
jgi:SAM-dependent methyltransferase